ELIIRYMTEQPLDFDPGERYAYSNFGYSLLGRIIERTTGKQYGEFARTAVLEPLGIRRTRLGFTLLPQRAKDEVRYYDFKGRTPPAVMGDIGQEVPLPYGSWCLEAMDAHGGWIASAVDLVRFASAFDEPGKCPILSAESVESLFARAEDGSGYD